MQIFKLFGSIFVDNDEANKSIHKTDEKAQGLGKTFVKGAGKVAKFGAVLGGVAVAGGAAMFKMATKTAEATDRIDKMSQRLGLSREGFQKWDFVMSQAGVSIDSMQSGMKSLTQRMGDAIEGTGVGAEAFEKLGLTITESMTQEEAFDATIAALQGMEDGVEKAALAQELFGKSGQELLPLLNATAESTDELKLKAEELGLVMGDDAIDAGVAFTDTVDQLKRSFGQAFVSIGTQFMPLMQKLAEWVIDHMPEIQKFFKTAFDTISLVVTKAIDIFTVYVLPVLMDTFEWIKEHMPEIKAFFMATFEGIQEVVTVAIDIFNKYLKPALETLWELVKIALPIIKIIFEEAFNIIIALVKAAWEIFEKFLLPILKTVFEWIEEHMPEIEATFKFVFELIKGYIQFTIDVFTVFFEIIEVVYNFVKDTFSNIGDLIMAAFSGVTNFIDGIIDKFNKVKDAITGAISKVAEFIGVDTSEADNTITGSTTISNIQGLHNGGTTLTSGLVKVGEKGPEVLSLPQGATVAPLNGAAMGGINITITGNTLLGEDDVMADKLGEIVVNRLRNLGVVTA